MTTKPTKPSRVFIVEKQTHKQISTDIYRFGEVIYVFDGSRRPSMFDSPNYIAAIHRQLAILEFDESVDFVCPFGGLLSNTQFIAALTIRCKAYRTLFFDANSETFVTRIIQGAKENCDTTNANTIRSDVKVIAK